MRGISKLTITEDVALISFQQISGNLAFTAKILSDFSQQAINIDMISQSAPMGLASHVSFTIDATDIVKSLEIIKQFQAKNPAIKPMVNSGNCKIQLYGEEMRHTPGVAAEVFSVVTEVCSEVMLITTSEVDISILLPQHKMQEVVDALQIHFVLVA